MKDTECTIRALHGRFEILMVCITRASNEYVVVVNAYKVGGPAAWSVATDGRNTRGGGRDVALKGDDYECVGLGERTRRSL